MTCGFFEPIENSQIIKNHPTLNQVANIPFKPPPKNGIMNIMNQSSFTSAKKNSFPSTGMRSCKYV